MTYRLLLGLLLLTACQARPILQQLPAYAEAMKQAKPDEPKPPKLFLGSDLSSTRELVPYATLSVVSSQEPVDAAWVLWGRALKWMPDAVIFWQGDRVVTGAVGQYWGFGISTATTTYAADSHVLLLREAPAVLPFVVNEQNMVVSIEPAETGKGLIEGDVVLSINDAAIGSATDWMRSPLQAERLHMHPGDALKVIAIRQGTGRIAVELKAVGNQRSYVGVDGSLHLRPCKVVKATDADGPCWARERPAD